MTDDWAGSGATLLIHAVFALYVLATIGCLIFIGCHKIYVRVRCYLSPQDPGTHG